jgi:hypothetical protein
MSDPLKLHALELLPRGHNLYGGEHLDTGLPGALDKLRRGTSSSAGAAITRVSVRMKHDDRKQQPAVALSIVFVLIGIGWMPLQHVMKPAG